MSRAKNLSDSDIAKIVEVLDGWSGRLSWELLIDAIEKRMFSRYARQTLFKHGRIKDAFSLRKAALAQSGDRPRKSASSPEMQVAMDRIERLTAENQRLEAENTRLLEQFVRWTYNAGNRNLDQTFLDQPLPRVDREQTRPSRVGRAVASLAKKG
jgi:hypothetical protein